MRPPVAYSTLTSWVERAIVAQVAEPEVGAAGTPLVSIVVRSQGRPELEEALASIAAQGWKRIEVVVVDARGTSALELPSRCGQFPLRLVQRGRPLARSAAANAGLAETAGEFIGFLDEDDLWEAEHIESLVAALRAHSDAIVAYSGVRCPDHPELSAWFNRPFSRTWLALGNYIPLHAALVRRKAVALGCRFDEELDVYEDWDWWLQLAQHGEFVHLNRVTAVYRPGGSSGAGLGGDPEVMRAGRARVLTKWKTLWSGAELDAIFSECAAHMRQLPMLTAELAREREENARLAAVLEQVQASWSWRATAWLRRLAAQLRKS